MARMVPMTKDETLNILAWPSGPEKKETMKSLRFASQPFAWSRLSAMLFDVAVNLLLTLANREGRRPSLG